MAMGGHLEAALSIPDGPPGHQENHKVEPVHEQVAVPAALTDRLGL